MKENKHIKVIATITLFVIISGLIFFQDRKKESLPEKNIPEQSLQTDQENIEIDQEQQEGKRFLESFILTYNSYQLGNVSNIESLYNFMSISLQKREKEKVARLKKTFGDYQGFLTVDSTTQQTIIESYEENKLTATVIIEKRTIEGAFVPGPEGNERDGFILVDKNGAKYEGNEENLLQSKKLETFRVIGKKESDNWIIEEFQKVN
ncbi:MAG: hypothetical protein WC178_00060 [Candidatus Paceibacterota bacterium]